MQLNTDFDQRVVLNTNDLPWVMSPAPGVERRMIERSGQGQGWATSLVRYAPGASYPKHIHPAGEEILVMSGTFSDASGEHGAGTYVRNAPCSQHEPFSTNGCVLFVKLNQFFPDDIGEKRIDTTRSEWFPGLVAGLSVLPLHSFASESTALVRWEPGTVFNRHRHWGGEEILVLEGTFQDEHGTYPAGSWLRSQHLSEHSPFSEEGCLIFVKTGHLRDRSLLDQKASS